jgi:hypothetical protein
MYPGWHAASPEAKIPTIKNQIRAFVIVPFFAGPSFSVTGAGRQPSGLRGPRK